MISTFCLMIMIIPLLFLMGYFTIKIKRLIWNDDKIIPSMLAFLTLDVVLWIVYCIFSLYGEAHVDWQYSGKNSYGCPAFWICNLPADVLCIACFLSLNKWTSFCLRVRSYVNLSKKLKKMNLMEENEEIFDSEGR